MWMFFCPLLAGEFFELDHHVVNGPEKTSDIKSMPHTSILPTISPTNIWTSNPPSPASPRVKKNEEGANFWIEYMYIALVIIGVILIFLFQFGFVLGFLYEGMKHNTRADDTESSSDRTSNASPANSRFTFTSQSASKSSKDTRSSSQMPSLVAPSTSSNPPSFHPQSRITETTSNFSNTLTNIPPFGQRK